jgi:hypothetical protein
MTLVGDMSSADISLPAHPTLRTENYSRAHRPFDLLHVSASLRPPTGDRQIATFNMPDAGLLGPLSPETDLTGPVAWPVSRSTRAKEPYRSRKVADRTREMAASSAVLYL